MILIAVPRSVKLSVYLYRFFGNSVDHDYKAEHSLRCWRGAVINCRNLNLRLQYSYSLIEQWSGLQLLLCLCHVMEIH